MEADALNRWAEYHNDREIREDIRKVHRVWQKQRLMGDPNGMSKNFKTSEPFQVETLSVFVNGLYQEEGEDYTVIDSMTIRFKTAPLLGARINATYVPFDY